MKYPKVLFLKKGKVRLTFPFREDLIRFEEEARKILSEEAYKQCEISDYPKKFFWFLLKYTSKEESIQLIELAYKIVNE